MKTKHLFSILAVLSFSTFIQAESQPLILSDGEEIVFQGSQWDSVSCGSKIYNRHDFNIVVTKAGEEKISRIYEDGLLKGICKKDYTAYTPDKSGDTFLDFMIIEKLSDEDLEKILNSRTIGSCWFSGMNLLNPQKGAEPFASYKISAQIENQDEDENSPAIFYKAAREFIKDNYCGIPGTLTPEQLKRTRKVMGRLDIGFDIMIEEGARGEDLAEMMYPAKKIRERFNVSAEFFKSSGYSPKELLAAGFSFNDILDAKYSVAEMYNAGIPVKELKNHFSPKELRIAGVPAGSMKSEGFSAQELSNSGYGLSDLIDAKYDVKNEIRPLFSTTDFVQAKDHYGRRKYSNQYLRETAGFKVEELKNGGISLLELQQAGYDIVKEIKPLYRVKDFMSVADHYGRRVYSNAFLHTTLGYSARDLKENGVGLQELQQAGYDIVAEIKPLYKITDFMNVKDHYGRRVYGINFLRQTLKYSAKDLKDNGVGLQELQNAGYDIVSEIRPLFSIKDFMSVRDHYGRRVYGNDFLRVKLGYSAKELKDNGVGLQELQGAGYNIAADIKPLFTIRDFMAVKDHYGRRVYGNDFLKNTLQYSARELKDNGVGLQELRSAGYDLIGEIKPLFSIQDFINIKDHYGRRTYSNSYLRSDLGYSAIEMKKARISLRDLYQAGFTKQQLRDAGFSTEEVDAL